MRFQVKSMMVAVSMLLMMAGGLAFYDDFQNYNYVTDLSFMRNYTVLQASGAVTIAQAPEDSLSVYITSANGYNFVVVNQSNLVISPESSTSVMIRRGSRILPDYTTAISILIDVNTSNANELNYAHGYAINYFPGADYVELRRCATEILLSKSCGVVLNTSYFNSSLDGWNDSWGGWYEVFNDINLTTIVSGGYISFYVNGALRLDYRDLVYTNSVGGFAFGCAPDNFYNCYLYFDDVQNPSGSGGVPPGEGGQGWQSFSFPLNMEGWFGIGTRSDTQNFIIQHALSGTSYAADFDSIDLYDYAYPTNKHLIPYFVMMKNGAYLSPMLFQENPIRVELVISAPHPDVCFYNENETRLLDMNTVSLSNVIGAQDTYIYNPYIAGQGNQSYLPTNPWILTFLTGIYQNQSAGFPYFYCTSPENLTARLSVMNGSYNGYEFLEEYQLPIGYRFYANGTVDYDTWIAANMSDIYTIRHHRTEGGGEPEQDLVGILFSNEMIGLGVIVLVTIIGYGMLGGIGAFAASIIGIYVVVKFNLLPIWLFVIVIVAVAALGANAARELITGH